MADSDVDSSYLKLKLFDFSSFVLSEQPFMSSSLITSLQGPSFLISYFHLLFENSLLLNRITVNDESIILSHNDPLNILYLILLLHCRLTCYDAKITDSGENVYCTES